MSPTLDKVAATQGWLVFRAATSTAAESYAESPNRQRLSTRIAPLGGHLPSSMVLSDLRSDQVVLIAPLEVHLVDEDGVIIASDDVLYCCGASASLRAAIQEHCEMLVETFLELVESRDLLSSELLRRLGSAERIMQVRE